MKPANGLTVGLGILICVSPVRANPAHEPIADIQVFTTASPELSGSKLSGVDARVPGVLSAQAADTGAIAPSSLDTAQSPPPEGEPLPQTPVTRVVDLSDVQPTDWAYQALRSLVERYGVIAGYPDRTFRGDRTLSRYEFAATLSLVMDRFNQLIAENIQIGQEDIVTLQRLQEVYGTALQDLRDRLTGLEGRTTFLEATQFSTTTQLQGQTIFAFTNGSNTSTTVVSRTRLNLLTSFQGSDRLLTQLEFGNNGADAISVVQNQGPNLLGTQGILADGGGLDYTEVSPDVQLRRLYYTFRPQADLAVTVGAKIPPRDFIDRNSFANLAATDFSSSFFINNPLIVQNQIDLVGGAGAALVWNVGGGPLTVRSLYVAADGNDGSQGRGLFGDRYQGSLELEYAPAKTWAVRLQYTNAAIDNTQVNAVGVNAEWALNRTTAIFGRYGFGSYQGFNAGLGQDLDLNPQTWSIGLGFRNVGIPGSFAGIAIGQPFQESDLGDATQTNFEAFYNLLISDNVSITPTLMVVTDANNNNANPTIWQGTLRTVFSF